MEFVVNCVSGIDFNEKGDVYKDRIINLSVNPVNIEWINKAKELDEDYNPTFFNVQVSQNKQTNEFDGFECFYLTGYDFPEQMGFLTEGEQKICIDYINNHVDEIKY